MEASNKLEFAERLSQNEAERKQEDIKEKQTTMKSHV